MWRWEETLLNPSVGGGSAPSSSSSSWREAISRSLPPLRSFARTVCPPLAGSAPLLQNFRFFDLEKAYFCRLLSAKICIYSQKMSKYPRIRYAWQWRSQGLEVGWAQGVWGTEVPQRGPGAEPRWGSGGEAPKSQIYICNLQRTNAFFKQYRTFIKQHTW